MNLFLMVAGCIFAIGSIAERNERKFRCMMAGFTVCVVGMVVLQVLC